MKINTVEDLITFMGDEAKRWDRVGYDSDYANAVGIKNQWGRIKTQGEYPRPLFFMISVGQDFSTPDGHHFEIKSLWFDKKGKKTARPVDLL